MRAALLVLLLAGCVVRAGEATPATLPHVTLAPLDGTAAAPLAQLAHGRPMLIDFFATWCQPCRESMPRVEAYARQHGGRLFVVGVDVGEEAAEVAPFVHDVGVAYPILLDHDFKLADAVGASRVPSILVVAGDGRILHRGHVLDAETRAAVDRALAQ